MEFLTPTIQISLFDNSDSIRFIIVDLINTYEQNHPPRGPDGLGNLGHQ